MTPSIFEQVKAALNPRLSEVLPDLLPGGKNSGKEYVCASLEGGQGSSCATNLETGTGSDFATGESWSDIIALAAKIWKVRQYDAAQELAKRYGISQGQAQPRPQPDVFRPILPVPDAAPEPPRVHPQHGRSSGLWRYQDMQGRTLSYAVRFDLPDGEKVVLPLCYGKYGTTNPQWHWKSLPEPRPLYNLPILAALPESSVLLVEGEKTADAAQTFFPHYAVLTWSGGTNAVSKADFSPLHARNVVIWPDNDEPGFKAALALAEILERKVASLSIVQPPDTLPEKWDLADFAPAGFLPQIHIETALPVPDFLHKAAKRFPELAPSLQVLDSAAPVVADELADLTVKEWPVFSWEACPGIVGDFVSLATRDSEADPAAVCITALVRFAAEVYGFGEGNVFGKGPHIYVGETIHPPRLFSVICGNSSKARKGTSRYPVTKLFSRVHCQPSHISALRLPLPARESGGPLSTGEGLAYQVREESEEERERRRKLNPNEVLRDSTDKRLMIQDEEFASALACTKREGNTLSMGIRCFWDSGDYAPLTKNNPVLVKDAHICIITHITMLELNALLGEVQAVNGFGNRFLWICARRSKLVALPPRMPDAELAPIQNELWRLVSHAQQRGLMSMTSRAKALWESIYPELSKEHTGLAGNIINRAEAQTLRLSLIYALLDGQSVIEDRHLNAALAMWQYAQDSALYIFGDRAADPLENKVLEALKSGPLTATELSAALHRNIPKDRLQPLLQQLEAQQRISISKQKSGTRSKLIIALREVSATYERNEINETNEKREGTP